jgi:CubicO group peptidase (beta-lactamase class C family)
MKHRLFLLKSTILCLLITFTSFHISYGQSKLDQLDELIEQYHEYGKFNGSVLVAEKGKVIYKKGFGMANMEWDIPNAPNTKHRLGSITKQFTAMLILQLVEEGKLDLESPITTYLPDYPKANGDRITTHHLLTHTAGIPNYTNFPEFFRSESRNPYTPDDFVEKFSGMDLEFTPGEQFNYSNSGYFLLGVIIEKLTGKTYEQALHDNIFTPLKMNDTGYDHHETILKNRATGYDKNGSTFINSSYLDMSLPYAAGSMYSTVEDLYIWDQALYTNQLLSQEYMDLYFKPQIPAGNNHYAYGWFVGNETIGNTSDDVYMIAHGGGINGFNTNIARFPSDKSLVVLFNNTRSAPLNEMTRMIVGIINEKPYDLPKKSVAFELLEVIESKGIADGVARYKAIKDAEKYELIEGEMNNIGYQLMGNGKTEEAAKVFKLNTEAFPESFNVYDSYAEALMTLGENDLAIANYKKSIEMNPGNQNGIEMLKKLGVNEGEVVEEVSVPDAVMESYVGKYELMPNFILTITKEDSQLKAQATGQPKFDIYPKSENVFYLKVIQAQLTFNKGDDGQIKSVTLLQGGQEIIGDRIGE